MHESYKGHWPPLIAKGSHIPTRVVCGAVGLLSYAFMRVLQRMVIVTTDISHGQAVSMVGDAGSLLDQRPLLTLANHTSTLDEPLLWAILPPATLATHPRMRWTLAAHEICFSSPAVATFFSLGQSIPITRGLGINQVGIHMAGDVLNRGGWVHVFPEAKVTEHAVLERFKWGSAKLWIEAVRNGHEPVVVPIYHAGIRFTASANYSCLGMEKLKPYHKTLPRLFQKVTVGIGQPVDMRQFVKQCRGQPKTDDDEVKLRIAVIQQMECAMKHLESIVLPFHNARSK